MRVLFLDIAHVLRIHLAMIERYGGTEGVRDIGMLHSAIAMPQTSFGGERLHKDIFEMAAAYLYHTAQNHPFLDGNKRVAAASAVVFLQMNGFGVEADEDGLVEVTIRAVLGEYGKREIADWFRQRAR